MTFEVNIQTWIQTFRVYDKHCLASLFSLSLFFCLWCISVIEAAGVSILIVLWCHSDCLFSASPLTPSLFTLPGKDEWAQRLNWHWGRCLQYVSERRIVKWWERFKAEWPAELFLEESDKNGKGSSNCRDVLWRCRGHLSKHRPDKGMGTSAYCPACRAV